MTYPVFEGGKRREKRRVSRDEAPSITQLPFADSKPSPAPAWL